MLPQVFINQFKQISSINPYNIRSATKYRPVFVVLMLNNSALDRLLGSRNRNRKLLISRAPTNAKSQEAAYSQALNQNKIDRQRSRSRESGRQTVRRLWWMVFGVETGR